MDGDERFSILTLDTRPMYLVSARHESPILLWSNPITPRIEIVDQSEVWPMKSAKAWYIFSALSGSDIVTSRSDMVGDNTEWATRLDLGSSGSLLVSSIAGS